MYCQDCGAPNHDTNLHCTECGRLLAPRMGGMDGSVSAPPREAPRAPQAPHPHQPPQSYNPNYPMQYPYPQKSRLGAGLMQVLIPVGIGRFYLGYTGIGIAQFLTAIFCGVGVIWAFVDGIIMLLGTPQTDANGVPLKD